MSRYLVANFYFDLLVGVNLFQLIHFIFNFGQLNVKESVKRQISVIGAKSVHVNECISLHFQAKTHFAELCLRITNLVCLFFRENVKWLSKSTFSLLNHSNHATTCLQSVSSSHTVETDIDAVYF